MEYYSKYDFGGQSMLHTTNRIELLNRDSQKTTRMKGALPNPETTILLLSIVAMTRSDFHRNLPKLNNENKKLNIKNEWNFTPIQNKKS